MKPKMEETKDMSLENIKIENIKGLKDEDAKEKGDSDQEMLNLENEIYSLTHYADDEEELVAQMFATIKGSKLEAMMPPILKEIPLIDVQQLCLHELRGMSQRRILSIINGQEMSGSSSEDSDEDKPSKLHGDNEDSNVEGKMEEGDDILTGKDLNDLENVNESNLTALDILELEMRAKLIKTMLENQDGDDDDDDDKDEEGTNGLFDPNIKIKEEPLTPEHKKGKGSMSPEPRRKSKYPRSRRRRRSVSRSFSSSSSRSSYSSRSRSYSRSASSRSRSFSSDNKNEASGSPDSKKLTKKKITKKEFEERMKKAKMNRSYRRRKESEEDSGGEKSKSKRKTKKKEETIEKATEEVPETTETPEAVPTEEGEEKPVEQQEMEEGEEGQQAEEEKVEEKEEGEIDSNEEGAYSSGSRSSRSRSRSYSSYSSFYSSRSRSYSRSPRRRKKSKKSKAKRKHRRSRSRSLSDVPKIPNWKPKTDTESKEISEDGSNSTSEPKITLPSKEDRESISFSFNKKNAATIKANSDLNDDGMPCVKTSQEESNTEEGDVLDVNDADQSPQMETLPVEEKPSSIEEESHTPPPVVKSNTPLPVIKSNTPLPVIKSNTPLPVVKSNTPIPKSNKSKKPSQIENADPVPGSEDFYKGADQLSFSEEEGECDEDDVDLGEFLHDDTSVEPINDEDSILRKSVNVVASKDETPISSWKNKKKKERKGDMVMEGVEFIKAAHSESHSNVDSPMEEDFLPDEGEDSRQDVTESVQETEAEDSRDSHNLEIIGVIDPTDNQETPFDEDLAAGGSSWSMRWLQSEKVQKVVSNSTLLSKVRKKIQARGKGIVKEIPKSIAAVPKQPVEIKPKIPKVEMVKPQQAKSSGVIGSIEEYEKLVGIKVKAPTSLPQPKPQSKAVIQAVSLLDSGDDEDSEEEAIWSKIMKK